ncbi:MAG: hypothetical protein ACI86M_003939, partial [Saprospiraceae bacterium]
MKTKRLFLLLILKFSDACVGVIKRCFCIKTPYHKKDP